MQSTFDTLVEQLGIPVVTGWNAHDILTNESPFYVGRPGTVGDRAGNFSVQNADFVLVLGCRLNIRQISYNWKAFAPGAWKAMVDVDEAELLKPTLSLDLKVHATLVDFIPKLIDALGSDYRANADHQAFLLWCRDRVGRYPVVESSYRNTSGPINPYHFMELLFDGLKSDDVVVTGNGSACVMSFQAAQLKAGQRLFTNSGNASMGYDLPAAIGACIALNGKRVICLAGDGSLMMNLQELQTLLGFGLPVKVLVLSNDGYHSIRQTQTAYFSDNLFGTGPSDGVSLPDFVRLAEAIGIPSTRVITSDDWSSEVVRSLLNGEGPAFIDVVVDPSQPFSPKLASRKLPDGTMVSPSLEDMAPFLSEVEMRQNRLG
jgi:acetolactate synthase-1/2/3 large subunit